MHVGQRQAREALQVAQRSRLGGAGRWGGAGLGAFEVHFMRIPGAFEVRSRRRRPEIVACRRAATMHGRMRAQWVRTPKRSLKEDGETRV